MQKEWNNFWIAKQKSIFKKIKRSRKTLNMIQVLFSKSYRADFIFKNMDGVCLDMGCGYSILHQKIDQEHVYGIDISLTDLKGKKRVIQGDVCRLPFKTGVFDTIIAGEIIEHVQNPIELIKESFRVLKRGGGVLIITTPNKRSWYNRLTHSYEHATHISLMDPPELYNLVNSYFLIEDFFFLPPDESWYPENTAEKFNYFISKNYVDSKYLINFLKLPIIRQIISSIQRHKVDLIIRRAVHFLVPQSLQEGMIIVGKKCKEN